jgi:putative membrane protein
MVKLLLRLFVNGFAFYLAVRLLDGNGINAQAMEWWGYLFLALIFGVVNAFVRPVLTMLGCPFIILTLGLGVLLINTLMFYLTGLIGTQFGVGFTVDGFLPAFWGALIVTVVSFLMNMFVREPNRERKKRKSH